MSTPTLTLTLDEADCRFLLEALKTLEAQWRHINETTTDEDEQADYANDLLDLLHTQRKLETAAVATFGTHVQNTSRAEAGTHTPPEGE